MIDFLGKRIESAIFDMDGTMFDTERLRFQTIAQASLELAGRPIEERTHYQMYETCTEGTPISPVMETPENLARWLADNGASAFGGQHSHQHAGAG